MADRFNRPRRIVQQARDNVSNPAARSWLNDDPHGKWEKRATDFLESTADKAKEANLTLEAVDDQIATMLAWLCVETLSRSAGGAQP